MQPAKALPSSDQNLPVRLRGHREDGRRRSRQRAPALRGRRHERSARQLPRELRWRRDVDARREGIVRLLRPDRRGASEPSGDRVRIRAHELLRDLGRRRDVVARVLAAVLGSVPGLRPDGLVDSLRSIQRLDRPDVLRRRLQECRWRRLLGGRQRGPHDQHGRGTGHRCVRSRDAAFEQLRRRLQDVRRGGHLGERSDRPGTSGGRGSGRSADPVRQPALFGGREHLPALDRRRRHVAAARGLRSIPVSRRPRDPALRRGHRLRPPEQRRVQEHRSRRELRAVLFRPRGHRVPEPLRPTPPRPGDLSETSFPPSMSCNSPSAPPAAIFIPPRPPESSSSTAASRTFPTRASTGTRSMPPP